VRRVIAFTKLRGRQAASQREPLLGSVWTWAVEVYDELRETASKTGESTSDVYSMSSFLISAVVQCIYSIRRITVIIEHHDLVIINPVPYSGAYGDYPNRFRFPQPFQANTRIEN